MPSHLLRFRFALRTLFVVVTVVAVLLWGCFVLPVWQDTLIPRAPSGEVMMTRVSRVVFAAIIGGMIFALFRRKGPPQRI